MLAHSGITFQHLLNIYPSFLVPVKLYLVFTHFKTDGLSLSLCQYNRLIPFHSPKFLPSQIQSSDYPQCLSYINLWSLHAQLVIQFMNSISAAVLPQMSICHRPVTSRLYNHCKRFLFLLPKLIFYKFSLNGKHAMRSTT